MKQKIVLEVSHDLKEGEILQFAEGIVQSTEIHELLPDLSEIKNIVAEQKKAIRDLTEKVEDLIAKVNELRGEDDE